MDDTSLASSGSVARTAQHTFTPTEKCNSSVAVHLSVLRYRSCSDNVNSAMEAEIRLTDSSIESRKPIICGAIGDLLDNCFPHVAKCLDSDREAEDLHRKQRELLATLFYSMTNSLGFSVKQCPAFTEREEFNVIEDSTSSERLTGGGSHLSSHLFAVLSLIIIKLIL